LAEENQQAIGRSVLILELIRSLSAPQDAIRTYAAWALSNFSSNGSLLLFSSLQPMSHQ